MLNPAAHLKYIFQRMLSGMGVLDFWRRAGGRERESSVFGHASEVQEASQRRLLGVGVFWCGGSWCLVEKRVGGEGEGEY